VGTGERHSLGKELGGVFCSREGKELSPSDQGVEAGEKGGGRGGLYLVPQEKKGKDPQYI